MRRDKGQAVLFDALIFLAIASMVSTTLLEVMSPHPEVGRKDVQDRLDRAHSVLLRTTIHRPDSIDGKNLTVLDHTMAGVKVMADGVSGEDQSLLADVKDILENMLPDYEFIWSVTCGSSTFYVMSDGARYGSGTDRYASHLSFPSIAMGVEIDLTLSAWVKA